MRAIGFREPGDPDVLTTFDVPEPHVGDDGALIRVDYATVNPSDVVTRSGVGHADRYPGVEPPFLPGWDAYGHVLDAGAETGFAVGDAVIAVTRPVFDGGGAYQDRIVVPAQSVTTAPHGVDGLASATLGMNGLTALLALRYADLDAGGTLAVTGAAGALGAYVVQLAAHRGWRVIADAKPEDRDTVAEFGATDVVPRGDDVATRIRDVAPDGVDALVDGSVQGDGVMPAVRDGGRYVAVRPEVVGGGTTATDRVTRHDVAVGDHLRDSGSLMELVRLVEEGVLTLRVADVYPAEQAARAHRRLEAGGVRGRLVLDFR